MQQWQKFGKNLLTDIGDITESGKHSLSDGRTEASTKACKTNSLRCPTSYGCGGLKIFRTRIINLQNFNDRKSQYLTLRYDHLGYCRMTTVWVKKIPLGFSGIFPKRLGIFRPYFTCLLHVHIYASIQIFIQLSPTVTKLCHIKCDHPACVSADGGHFEHDGGRSF